MKYRPEVDGLRAIAVVPVVFFHAGFSLFKGGFVGVDVFFVISGYLITSILLKELEAGTFSLLKFYERRARRILPALAVMVAACIPVAIFLMTPTEAKNFAQSVAAVGLFASNVLFWVESGYFDLDSEEKPLLHTWSLAVEEQFYIVFPLLLLLLWTYRRKLLVPILVFLALLSLVLCEWGARNAPSATFFLAPTRAWELLAGSFCAMILRRGTTSHDLLAALGVVMIGVSIFAFDETTPFPSVYALLPVGGTVFVILFAGPTTATGKLLAKPVFVGLGLISYSAYLWHQPLFAFARLWTPWAPSPTVLICLIILTFVIAYLSWRYVETPFRRTSGPHSIARRPVFILAVTVSLLFVAFGGWGQMTKGWRNAYLARMSEAEKRILTLTEHAYNEQLANALSRFDNGDCVFDIRTIDETARQRATNCAQKYGPGVLVLGDSHAIDLYGAVITTSQANEPFIVGVVSGGCRPHTLLPGCAYMELAQFIEDRPDVFEFAVYEQAGFYLLHGAGFDLGGRRMFERLSPNEPVPRFEPHMGYVQAVKEYLERIASHIPTVWLSPRIEPHIQPTFIRKAGCDYPYMLRPGTEEVFLKLEATIAETLSASPVEFMSQHNLLKLSFPEDFLSCDVLFWSDGDHFSNAGEERFGKRMQVVQNARAVLGLERK